MTEGNFELGVPGWYTPELIEGNDWLNKRLENTDYGLYYTVKFAGDANTHLWQAKTAPEEGKKYYGHIEMAKSGKSTRFKKDKEPEGIERPAGANTWAESPEKQASINRAVALNNAVLFAPQVKATESADVLSLAQDFYTWLAQDKVLEPEYTDEDIPTFPGDDDETH